MQLNIKFTTPATPVTLNIDGHSAVNGALIPEGSTVTVVSNKPDVATVAGTVAVPAGGAQTLSTPVTVLAVGSTDFLVTVTTPDGKVFNDTDTLVVEPTIPGLTHITATLVAG